MAENKEDKDGNPYGKFFLYSAITSIFFLVALLLRRLGSSFYQESSISSFLYIGVVLVLFLLAIGFWQKASESLQRAIENPVFKPVGSFVGITIFVGIAIALFLALLDWVQCRGNLDRKWAFFWVYLAFPWLIMLVLHLYKSVGLTEDFIASIGKAMKFLATWTTIIVVLTAVMFVPNTYFDRYTGTPNILLSHDGSKGQYCGSIHTETGERLFPPDQKTIEEYHTNSIEEKAEEKAGSIMDSIRAQLGEFGRIAGNYYEGQKIKMEKDSEKAKKEAQEYDPYAEPKKPEVKPFSRFTPIQKPIEKKKEAPVAPKKEISSYRELRIVSPSEDVSLAPGKISFCWEGENIRSRELVDLQFALPGPDGGYDPYTGFRFCNGWNFSRDCGFCTIPQSAVGKKVKVFAGVRPSQGPYEVLDYKYFVVK